jgi:hypothetical protein
MLNTMMIGGALLDSCSRRFGRSLFHLAFAGVATIAPQVLLAYAAVSISDPALRAHAMVGGCERIVLALALSLAVRAVYGAFTKTRGAPPSVAHLRSSIASDAQALAA